MSEAKAIAPGVASFHFAAYTALLPFFDTRLQLQGEWVLLQVVIPASVLAA